MIRPASYLRIVRASAWYDLLVTAGFATPWTVGPVLAALAALARKAGSGAGFPPFAPEHVLMANLLGSIVTVWAILRLCHPQVMYGRYDAAARWLFASWQLYALAHGAHPILWAFAAAEIGFGMAESLPLRRAQGGAPGGAQGGAQDGAPAPSARAAAS